MKYKKKSGRENRKNTILWLCQVPIIFQYIYIYIYECYRQLITSNNISTMHAHSIPHLDKIPI